MHLDKLDEPLPCGHGDFLRRLIPQGTAFLDAIPSALVSLAYHEPAGRIFLSHATPRLQSRKAIRTSQRRSCGHSPGRPYPRTGQAHSLETLSPQWPEPRLGSPWQRPRRPPRCPRRPGRPNAHTGQSAYGHSPGSPSHSPPRDTAAAGVHVSAAPFQNALHMRIRPCRFGIDGRARTAAAPVGISNAIAIVVGRGPWPSPQQERFIRETSCDLE